MAGVLWRAVVACALLVTLPCPGADRECDRRTDRLIVYKKKKKKNTQGIQYSLCSKVERQVDTIKY